MDALRGHSQQEQEVAGHICIPSQEAVAGYTVYLLRKQKANTE